MSHGSTRALCSPLSYPLPDSRPADRDQSPTTAGRYDAGRMDSNCGVRASIHSVRPSEVKPLAGLGSAEGRVLLSSDSEIIVTILGPGLVAYTVSTGQITPIPAAPDASPLDISEDGSATLIEESGSYRVFLRKGLGFRNLPLTGSATEAVLSGDGRVVFAITGARGWSGLRSRLGGFWR